jgi:hypothetical protein
MKAVAFEGEDLFILANGHPIIQFLVSKTKKGVFHIVSFLFSAGKQWKNLKV